MRAFAFGAIVGYVLGTRAGRARYEQIIRTYRKFADHPAVQGAAGIAWAKASEKFGDRLPFLANTRFSSARRDNRNASAPSGTSGTLR